MQTIDTYITLSVVGCDDNLRETYPIELDYEYKCDITRDLLEKFYKREITDKEFEEFEIDNLTDEEYEKLEEFAQDYYYDDAYEEWHISQLTAKDLY